MSKSGIAIIGMAGKFPGAKDTGDFWRNLRDGVESIRQLSDSELLAAGATPEEISNPDYVKAAAILENVEMFDAPFFGFSPKDASIADPQQRHFLECAWEALENAGHVPENFPGSIAVYAGSGMNSYLIHNLLTNRRLVTDTGLFMLKMTGNDKDVLATRVSYQLNLKGPSISVQTACSTSLVAVHLACQSLLNHECDMALAGGVTIEVPHGRGYVYREGEILSQDGHCRPFDASSHGTIFSSGAGVVVLRRLEDALQDRDTIHATILGSAINNDGGRKVGYFAPSVEGQAEVIAEAVAVSDVPAESIRYVETHGTGTSVGDPIEVKGLTEAFRRTTQARQFCAIGSLKSNVGHLDAAAGVAGLIKCVLALENRQIPPSLHFVTPNPLIDFETSPFYVNTKLREWTSNASTPRRAGVTSLGIGGTNAHVVLEEAPQAAGRDATNDWELVLLSARTESGLEKATARLVSHLRENPSARLSDVAFTSQVGRRAFPHRRIVVGRDLPAVVDSLATLNPEFVAASSAVVASPSVVFMFSGQGAQYINMGADLYRTDTTFRHWVDLCAERLKPTIGWDIRTVLVPQSYQTEASARELDRTEITQPALFCLEYSLARWWMNIGVEPKGMVGHSVGEFVAACLAGIFSLDEALELIVARGRLMQQAPAGAMTAVALSAGSISVSEPLSIAAENGPEQCVVSGPTEAIERFEHELTDKGISFRRLSTSHAFHSRMMDPIIEPFRERVARVNLQAPKIPFLSNVTGTWITAAQATDPAYWVKQLRQTVKFSDCLSELFKRKDRILLEIGPGHTLASLARQHPKRNAKVVSSLRQSNETISDQAFLLKSLGLVWMYGQPIRWSALHSERDVRRVPLPTYPFERQRYWIEPGEGSFDRDPKKSEAIRQTEKADAWFQRRVWRKTALPNPPRETKSCCVVFNDQSGLGDRVISNLKAAGARVIVVASGDSYAALGSDRSTIRPGVRADYDDLMDAIEKTGAAPQKFVHLWSVRGGAPAPPLERAIDLSFYSPLYLLQSLGDQDPAKLTIALVSDRLQSTSGEPVNEPVRATLLGPARVMLAELPGIKCYAIDVTFESGSPDTAATQVFAEVMAESQDFAIAYRGQERWVESFSPSIVKPDAKLGRLKEKGVYLITGGTGGIGLVIAEYLARKFKAKLILVSRTAVPAPNEWEAALKSNVTPENLKLVVRKLDEIRMLGGEVLTIRADVTSAEDMSLAVNSAIQKFGTIDGVIHAAGVIDDGPVLLKTRDSAQRVLDPKIQGTIVLADALRDVPLDFMVLFSSVSSFTPPPGQADYAAANAFLDAFAESRPDRRTISINWARWNDAGLARETTNPNQPLLDRHTVQTSDVSVYSSDFDFARRWVLNEHRFRGGDALMPGTGFLEMVVEASGSLEAGGVELHDVFFVAPFAVGANESREIQLKMKKEGSGFRFSVASADSSGTEYATGEIAPSVSPATAQQDLKLLREKFSLRTIAFGRENQTKQAEYIEFGNRWSNLEQIHIGVGESLAHLKLPAEYAQDLGMYAIHPALLDLASGAALYLVENYEASDKLYLPFSYGRVSVFGKLPAELYSHIRSRKRNTSNDEVVTFDVTVMDAAGRPLIDIEEFSLRRIDTTSRVSESRRSNNGDLGSPAAARTENAGSISSADGIDAFAQIMSSGVTGGIVVSPSALVAISNPDRVRSSIPAKDASLAPKSLDSVEAQLMEIWEDLLGVAPIRPHDNFFDLGGHSLLAARLSARVKKQWGTSLPITTLFEAPTIEKMAALLRGRTNFSVSSPRVAAIKPEGNRPPFLCVDAGPYFRALAKRLDPDQPFLGLRLVQPEKLPVHFTMADIAAYHLETIRSIQPQGPYYLGGWSASGFVAYEMAQQLKAQGQEVALVVLFDSLNVAALRPPSRSGILREQLKYLSWKAKFHSSRLRNLNAADRRKAVKALYARMKLDLSRVSWVVSDKIQRHALRPLATAPAEASKAVFVAARDYRSKPYDGPVLLFRSAVQSEGPDIDRNLGWRKLVQGGLEVREMPGDHEDMFREPFVELLANELDLALSEARKRLAASFAR